MTTPSEHKPWPVAVFAYNEAEHIVRCLESIHAAADGHAITVYVLINGCTDNTTEVVMGFAEKNSWVRPVDIARGDKSNAWNVFVHDCAPSDSNVYFFVDGDVRIGPRALPELAACFESPAINAAAAVPASGRNRDVIIEGMKTDGGLSGNLYALSGSFIDRIRERNIRLPVGFIGEDSLVGALSAWDLDPVGNAWDKTRTVTCEKAQFFFDPLSFLNPGHWRLYWRRRINYGVRDFQNKSLRTILKTRGAQAMPAEAKALFADRSALRPRWNGLNTLFLWLAARRLRRA